MSELETRRIVPMAYVATTGVVILVVFELLIILGAFELKPATVANVAPWAYEPFLKLIGEHPDSKSKEPEEVAATNKVVTVAGFSPEELSVTLDPEVTLPEPVIIEPTVPLEGESMVVPVIVPATVVDPEEVVPVG